MLRAFDSNNTRAQEETLKALQQLAPDMSYNLLREQLTPRVVRLPLNCTACRLDGPAPWCCPLLMTDVDDNSHHC
jgi:hypothetical protein